MSSHKTAMYRTKPSAPAKKLKLAGLIRGRVLDYGCGHGFDAHWLRASAYDLEYQPDYPSGRFDTILCTYVLNTIRSALERQRVLNKIRGLLTESGRAFITVRRDVKVSVQTLNGWQGDVRVPDAISLWRNSNYEIYVIGRSL